MMTNPPIAGKSARLTTTHVPWADDLTLVTVVHLDIAPSYAEVYRSTRSGAQVSIGKSGDLLGKVDSASSEVYADGTVRLWVAQADNVAGSSGDTNKIKYYDFPGAVPAQPPVSGSSADGFVRDRLRAVRNALLPLG
jgi:hypothetical protein